MLRIYFFYFLSTIKCFFIKNLKWIFWKGKYTNKQNGRVIAIVLGRVSNPKKKQPETNQSFFRPNNLALSFCSKIQVTSSWKWYGNCFVQEFLLPRKSYHHVTIMWQTAETRPSYHQLKHWLWKPFKKIIKHVIIGSLIYWLVPVCWWLSQCTWQEKHLTGGQPF